MEDIKVAVLMVATQVFEVGLNTLIKAATDKAQTLIYVGIGYSSPVLASVTADLSPVFTLFVAIVFRHGCIVKAYPKVVMTATIASSFFIMMLSSTVALFSERNNPQARTLCPDMELPCCYFIYIL
ncbi:hypothetical protein K1719_017247 [Acacia pycnantha]|nr:hypothetical protein K1719_017247 [Acacia pycnantha]